MTIIRIDGADDPRIAAYRDIRERDLVGRQGRFIAEGKVVLSAMLAAGRFAPESLLVMENRLDGLSDVVDRLPSDTPVYVADRAVMDAIAGFPMHRGVLAVGLRGTDTAVGSLVAALPAEALVVVAVGISNHDNLGSIFRNAAAFGASAVLLDGECCDPLYRKAIRVSVGAALTVPFARSETAGEIVGMLSAGHFRQLALSPSGARSIRDVAGAGRTAIYLGTEGEGLPHDLMSRLETVRIPIAKGFDSLNVAAASAIALHELARLGVNRRG